MFDDQPVVLLHAKLANKDWFHSIEKDKSNRLVVYVKYMCDETTTEIPRQIGGLNVLCHFASSKHINQELFVRKNEKFSLEDTESVDESSTPLDLRDLTKELDRLEKICGSNILGDIFFEENDGKNAVTNLSIKYPEVRKSIHNLFEKYGFDVIYEELEL